MNTVNTYKYVLNKYVKSDLSDPIKTFRQISGIVSDKTGDKLSISTLKLILSGIIWKLTKHNEDNELIDRYKAYLNKLRQISNEREMDHSNVNGYIPKWSEIIKSRDEADNIFDYLLLSLYTMIPPRRLKDYILMKISFRCPIDNIYNYYCTSKRLFIFNKYKTSKVYGRQIIEAPEQLHKTIMQYIDENDLNEGDSLLGYDKYYNLSKKLKRLIGCSVDNIRHSYINEMYKNYDIPDNSSIESIANMMGHSVSTHLRYRKH